MNPISRTLFIIITLAVMGSGLVLLAAPITPDPADCHLTVLPSTTSTGVLATETSLVALSGDGKTALYSTRFQTNSEGTFHILQDEFFVRDGIRTLLTHYDTTYSGNEPRYLNGPSWNSVDLPFDGSFVATESFSDSAQQGWLLTLPDVTRTALPLAVFKLSGSGVWVIGVNSNGLVRFRPQDGHTEVLFKDTNAVNLSVFSVSYAGDTVYGISGRSGNVKVFRWTATEGFSRPTFPEGFVPSYSTDAVGEFLPGYVHVGDNLIPAYWSQRGGLVKLTTVLNGMGTGSGMAKLISGDGQLLFGTLGRFDGAQYRVVWTRGGTVYPLESLIRGVDLQSGDLTSVTVVSHDGRAIGGEFYQPPYFTNHLYLANLALPGEGPRVALRPAAGGGRTLNFHAKTGFHYQVQSSTKLGGWAPAAAIPKITGDDADHAVPLPPGSEGTTFFRILVSP